MIWTFSKKAHTRLLETPGKIWGAGRINPRIALILPALFLVAFYATSSEAARKKVRFSVPGIQCATSAVKATEAVTSVPGVIEAMDGDQTLTVIFDDEKADFGSIKEALKKSGYPAEGEPRNLEQ